MSDPVHARPDAGDGAVRLVGLDFGSTTSSALLASARVMRNCATGRMELGEPVVEYRSDPAFTPFAGEEVDEPGVGRLLDRWSGESGTAWDALGSGGAIVTGLAARKRNAAAILRLVRARIPDALIATADDPSFESWLAFMGSVGALSRARPETPILNLDVGGGTSNLALGIGGEVRGVGCLWVGARHVRVVPGSYRIEGLSSPAVDLFRHLGIAKGPGDALTAAEVDAVVGACVSLLEAAVDGDAETLRAPWARALEVVPYRPPADLPDPVITVSGGVGELLYAHAGGRPLPPTTAFGDLGIDLARALARSPRLARDLRTAVPAQLGRATVYGLALSGTEVSGTTLHLPRADALPLRDLPIVARLPDDAPVERFREAFARASAGGSGAGVQITRAGQSPAEVRRLGATIARALAESRFPADRPLVVFVPGNVGKALGSYASEWGRRLSNLIVVDEMVDRRAHFASLGAVRDNVVPVSFYGIE